MAKKLYKHDVTINDIRRDNKRIHDMQKKGASKRALHQVFNNCYRDQVRALYRVITRSK